MQPSDEYILEIIRDRYGKMMDSWRRTKAKPTRDGRAENSEEVEARIEKEDEVKMKKSRQASRHYGVSFKKDSKTITNLPFQRFRRRCGTADTIIKRLSAILPEEDPELCAWIFLKSLLEELGPDGMSSDESANKNGKRCGKFFIKLMPWRRQIGDYMDFVDYERAGDGKV